MLHVGDNQPNRTPPSPPRTVTLALGGGAARGLAHIGVLRGLEEDGVRPVGIAGTSMGSIVGGLAAQGRSSAEMVELMEGMDWRRVGQILLGSVVGTRFSELLHELFGEQRIEELAIPFGAVCGDLETGAEVVVRRGVLADAVRASSAIPGMLTPVIWNGRTLVDGIVVTPVPTTVARSLATAPLLAVNVIGTPSAVPLVTEPSRDRPLVTQPSRLLQRFNRWMERHSDTPSDTPQLPDRFQVSMRSFHIMVFHLAARTSQTVGMLEPAVGHLGWFDFHRVDEAVDAGYQAYRQWRARHPLHP